MASYDDITNNRTVMLVNLQFCRNEQLTVPYARSNREPKLFSVFPEARKKFMYFCNQKINDGSLFTELVWCEVQDHIATDCYNNYLKEVQHEVPPTFDEFKKTLDITSISYSTIWRWLLYLGYKYDTNSKSYYTDGHERKDVVEDRNERFLGKYYDYELFTYRWIQLTEEESNKLEGEHKDFPKNCYHSYEHEDVKMREYHIDTHPILQDYIIPGMHQYGGNLSVRKKGNRDQ